MKVKLYIAVITPLLFALISGLQAQSLSISIQLNNVPQVLSEWQNRPASLRMTIKNNTSKLLLATPYIEISNQKGAVANNGAMSGEFIELRPGANTFYADQLLPAYGINYIRGLPDEPLNGGSYEICLNVDISGNGIEGETQYRQCVQWTVAQTPVKKVEKIIYSGAQLLAPVNNLRVTEEKNRVLRFSWTPVRPSPDLSVTYLLGVYKITPEETPEEVMAGRAPIWEMPVVGSTRISWPSTQPLAENGHYFWTVRPVNNLGEALLPSPGISEIRRFQIDCDVKRLIPKTPDGLYHIELPIPEKFSLFQQPNFQQDICWEPLPLEGLNYQLHYTKSVCNSILSDSLPYPFAPFIPPSEEEEKINYLTYEIEKLNAEQKLWQDFAAKHVQRFIWAENEIEKWESLVDDFEEVAMEWPEVLQPLNDVKCDQEEVCCGDHSCCHALNVCSSSERELYLNRLKCQEDQLENLRHRQLYHLLSFLGLFTRKKFISETQPKLIAYKAYFRIYHHLVGLFRHLEGSQTQQFLPFMDVLKRYPDLRYQAPNIYRRLIASTSSNSCWQELATILDEAEHAKKLPPSTLITALDEHFRLISPERYEAMGKTRGGNNESIEKHLQSAYEYTQCLLSFSINKKEHIDACQPISQEVVECLESSKRKLNEEKQRLVDKGIRSREIYWESMSDSIQRVFEEVVKELGSNWKEEVCQSGGRFSLPGAQTESAITFKEQLAKKLGRKICFLNFGINIDCTSPQLPITLSHSYPLLRRNENCCSIQTELSWQLSNPFSASGKDPVCVSLPNEGILKTFNDQLAILNPQAPSLSYDDITAGRWSVSVRDSLGIIQGYSPQKIFELRETQAEDLMLLPEDTTNCGCQNQVYLNHKEISSGSKLLMTETNQSYKIRIEGQCEGGCQSGPTYISIQPPAIRQMHKDGTKFIDLPFLTFGENIIEYNFPQTGLYTIKAGQICNGHLCESSFEVEILPSIKQNPVLSDWHKQIPVEKNGYCLSGLYKVDIDTAWQYTAFNDLNVGVKSKVDFLIKSSCLMDCEQLPQYIWTLKDPGGKEQIIEEASNMVNYHFKKAGLYQIIVKELFPCSDGLEPRQTSFLVTVGAE